MPLIFRVVDFNIRITLWATQTRDHESLKVFYFEFTVTAPDQLTLTTPTVHVIYLYSKARTELLASLLSHLYPSASSLARRLAE